MKTTIKKKYLIFAAAALTLAACSNDENLNGGPVELRLSSSLEVQTRAYQVQDEQLARGETVYVWADEQDGETDYIKAWELMAVGNGSFQEPATKQYFPQSGKGLSLQVRPALCRRSQCIPQRKSHGSATNLPSPACQSGSGFETGRRTERGGHTEYRSDH